VYGVAVYPGGVSVRVTFEVGMKASRYVVWEALIRKQLHFVFAHCPPLIQSPNLYEIVSYHTR
jgi:hypothetical protein